MQSGIANQPYQIKRIRQYCYSESQFIGKGNFSRVYRGINTQDNSTVAIKVKDLSLLATQVFKVLHQQELEVLKIARHNNIVQCFEIVQEDNTCFIISEFCEKGDLDVFIKRKGVLSLQQAFPLLRDILQGMIYLSKLNVVHRDLKVSNVLLKGNTAKVADFGFAKLSKSSFTDENIGSPLYMSPEAFIHSKYNSKTDVWSFGILMFELMHGDTPYGSCILEQDLIRTLSIPFNRSKVRSSISMAYKEAMFRCLEINEEKRISFEQLRQLQFFRRISTQKELKQYQPDQHSNNLGVNIDQYSRSRTKSSDRLYPGGSGTNIRVNFVSPMKNLKEQEKGQPIQKQIPRPQSNFNGQNSANKQFNYGSNLSPNANNANRQNNFVRILKPKSSQKRSQAQTMAESPRIRIVSIDSRKPVQNQSLFKPSLSFKIAVNILHYCRCLYRFIQLLIAINQPEQQLRFLVNWLMLILEELKIKTNNSEIIFSGDKRQVKIDKFREVRTDYQRKYITEFRRYLPNFRNRPALKEVRSLLLMEFRKFDNKISNQGNQTTLELGIYSILLYDSTRLLQKCNEDGQFIRYANYRQLQQILLLSKKKFNRETYFDLRRKIIIDI